MSGGFYQKNLKINRENSKTTKSKNVKEI